MHAFGEGLQMMKAHFDSLAVDNLFGSPLDRNSGTRCCHHHEITIRAAFQIPDITIMRQNSWPHFKVGGRLENRHSRCVNDDRVGGVHSEHRTLSSLTLNSNEESRRWDCK